MPGISRAKPKAILIMDVKSVTFHEVAPTPTRYMNRDGHKLGATLVFATFEPAMRTFSRD